MWFVFGYQSKATVNCSMSLQFNGGDQWVEESNAAVYLNGLDALTVSVWIKPEETKTNAGFLKCHSGDGSDENSIAIRYDEQGWSNDNQFQNLIKAGLSTNNGKHNKSGLAAHCSNMENR